MSDTRMTWATLLDRAVNHASILGFLLILGVPIGGCARYYYSKPGGTAEIFQADSIVCARDFGIASGNGQYAAVSPDLYRRCMASKGWEREKRVEAGPGWYRGVEENEPVILSTGVEQPAYDGAPPSHAALCARRYPSNVFSLPPSDREANRAAYKACMGQK